MFGECHAHIAMDGINYKQAMMRHANGPDEAHIRACFSAYRARDITFVRDGGDAYGVSTLAATIAPEYGICYRTPAFAIHRKGNYGSIVGRSYENMREFAQRVEEAAALGADFIKIMTTGIMDFNCYGKITHQNLPASEVREMVHIAHEQGFAVMSHTNGKQAVLDAVEAGVDSIEHGNYIDAECIQALVQARCCLVPTATVARNLIANSTFDNSTLERIVDASRNIIAQAVEANCLIALGSDAGAVGVKHGQGVMDEYELFCEAVPDTRELEKRLMRGEAHIRNTFVRK